MKFAFVLILMSLSTAVIANGNKNKLSVFGDAVLRYENETRHINLADRERLRLIARLGASYQLNDSWKLTGRLRTGLKDKQNVPAVTLHKFNEQPTPDSDVFVDRLFLSGNWQNSYLKAGKIPWGSWQNTDMFWDRDLNPIGVHLDYQINSNNKLSGMIAKPLDGNSSTIGTISVLQWQHNIKWQDWTFKIAPWYVNYSGEDGAEFARKDTQLDNQFVRLALNAKYQKWSFGLDLGRSLESFDSQQFGEFADDKNAIASEIKYGGLKSPGDLRL